MNYFCLSEKTEFIIYILISGSIKLFVRFLHHAQKFSLLSRQHIEEDKANDAGFLIETTICPGYARP